MSFVHHDAAERQTCPRIDGHYVPKRCQAVFRALQRAVAPLPYDRLVVDQLGHTRHERKLRELRGINREYDALGHVIWDLVLERLVPGTRHKEFWLNRSPRRTAGDGPAEQPWGPGCRWERANHGHGSAVEIDNLLGVV